MRSVCLACEEVLSSTVMGAFCRAIHAAFHHPDCRSYRIVDAIIWVMILASVALFVVDISLGLDHPWAPWLALADWVVLGLFAIEISVRILSFQPPSVDFFQRSLVGRLRAHLTGRLVFCLRPMNLIDLLTVLALVPALRGLRALRLLRLLRTVDVFRYSNPFRGIARAFQENRLLYTFAFSLVGAATLLGGVSIFLIERGGPGGIQHLSDGFWWALVTLTTVGYGDITPVMPMGKIVGAFMMISGMFTLALFAGIVGRTLLLTVLSIREEQVRMSNYIDHLIICGYDPGARMLLDTVLREMDPEKARPVIFADGERPQSIPNEFTWVKGDPTKESELDKVRMSHAAAAIIVGSRSAVPQQADAVTILTAFTIRAYLAKQRKNERRAKPLYLVAEVLDSENVAHAKAAGADEVIESTRLGFSMLAHAISMHGSATVMSQVLTAGAQSVYVGRLPEGVQANQSFAALRKAIKEKTGALLIGVRGADADSHLLNPAEDFLITAEHLLIYFCDKASLPPA